MSKKKRSDNLAPPPSNGDGHTNAVPTVLPVDALARIDEHVATTEPFVDEEAYAGAIGRTMFDTAGSHDGTVTGLTPPSELERIANQALVRIKSVRDGRVYLGAISSGPFAEPDGLRADAPVLVTATVRGGLLMPRYHGRMQIALIAEEVDGKLAPPRRRPLPNSPVFLLGAEETARVLNCVCDPQGDSVCLGVVEGMESVEVHIPTAKKNVLPRHLGVLGTTGGGKSTTVSGLISRLQQAGWAVVLLDTEGEYTSINDDTIDDTMHAALHRRKLKPQGVENTHLYHLVGRETTNPKHPSLTTFTLPFAELSPYTVAEILDFPEAQHERFLKAYDITKIILEKVGIQKVTLEVDELDSGYPGMTLDHVADIVNLLTSLMNKDELTTQYVVTPQFKVHGQFEIITDTLKPYQKSLPGSPPSWKGLSGRLGRLRRLRVFDSANAKANVKFLDYASLIKPGRVSIFDLSDMDVPVVNNLAIAMLLRGIQQRQDELYQAAEKLGQTPTPTIVLIEEAHEFLSADRVKQMPTLFSQVAQIAKRGRKRWLALGFITQLPQHLPDEVLALINNWILHKISDANVISRLRRSIGGIDESLWSRLLSLAPGQAVISFGHLTRPLQVAIDPTPCRLHMVD